MKENENIMRILDSTNQAAPHMTASLANFGDGHMGIGILNLMNWCTRRGVIKGAVITGSITSAIGLASSLFLWRKVKQQEEEHKNVVLDFLDELTDTRKDLTDTRKTLDDARKSLKVSPTAPNEAELNSPSESIPPEGATA